MATIHALLVGINKYHPQSRVANLAGCVNDIQAFHDFLLSNYESVTPTILLNEQATRKNIITSFTEQLIHKAVAGDTVLFYYAGHGSYSETAKPFKKYDPKGQDESFVCYDSRLPGHQDLTDKELAVLLSRITPNVHIVVIADSCHSASVTRSTQAAFNLRNKRFTSTRRGERTLDSYLLEGDNFYQDLFDQTGELSIPPSKHILISACDREEEAWETLDRRGLFSTSLLKILQENPNKSYADLFEQVRHVVYNTARNQKPTIFPLEGFNPNTVFLKQDILPNRKRHLVKFENGQWQMDYGGIHGLPSDAAAVDRITIGIYGNLEDEKNALLKAKATKVLLQSTLLAIENATLDSNKTYWGEIEAIPSAMLVNLEGKPKYIKSFLRKYRKNPSSFIQLVENEPSAKYTLKLWSRKLGIFHTETRQLIQAKKGTSVKAIQYIKEQLEHIREWENIAQLDNPQADAAIANAIETTFFEELPNGALEARSASLIDIDYWPVGEDKEGDHPKARWYQIEAKNTSDRDLHVSLLYLSSKFGITAHFKSQVIPANSNTIVLDKDHGLAITNKHINQATDIFKVIISTTPFDDHKYQLEEINVGGSRQVISRIGRRGTPKDDWATQTMVVNTTRKQSVLGDSTTTFRSERISFKAHPTFKADIAFSPIKTPTRSLQPTRDLAGVFQGGDFELLNLAKNSTRSTHYQDKSIIELSGIKNKAALQENPLELTIHQRLKKGENIIPVTMKNGYLIPFGESTKTKDGKAIIKISDFPDADAAPSTAGKRSLGTALWFGLLKLTGFRDKAFRLRKVSFSSEGKVLRDEINLFPAIEKAEKILIVIHGIIGDTKKMLQNAQFLEESGQYDLILAFDYENLNEPIEKIAEELNKKLEKYKLGPDDGKRIDILSHSMGGLVSRYMIEQIRKGDNLIDHLIMFGTPNGGSIFGDIPSYRDMLIKLLTVGLNFGKHWLGPIGAILDGFNKVLATSKVLTVTLEQLSPTSLFIENLYKNSVKGATKYTVIAGDTSQYKNKRDAQFSRFMEDVLLKIGNTANNDTPNDIAVLVEQIKAIPPKIDIETHDICCHHLNYFDEGEGLETLKAVLKVKH